VLVYDTALEELIGDELVAIAAVEEGEETDDETVNPVLPTGGDIIWAAIFFFALWAVMKYVLMPPVQKVRAERAAKIGASSRTRPWSAFWIRSMGRRRPVHGKMSRGAGGAVDPAADAGRESRSTR